jgi:hypothetical protein
LDCKETTISGRIIINYTRVLTTTTVAGQKIKLIGSASSFFETMVPKTNSVSSETIPNYNLLYNLLVNSTINADERFGTFSVSQLTDNDSFNGIDLPLATTATGVGTYYLNFCVPIITLLGLNSLINGRLFPVGSIANLQLEVITAQILPIITYCTTQPASAAEQPIFSVSLDTFNLNCKYINIGSLYGQMIRSSLLNGKYYMKAQTYTGTNNLLTIGSSGTIALPFNIRKASVKSLFWYFATQSNDKCPNGLYDAICPNLTSLQVDIGGLLYPQRALRPVINPAETYNAYLQAHGGTSLKSLNGVISKSFYCVTLDAVTGSDSAIVVTPSTIGGNAGYRLNSSYETVGYLMTDSPHMHYEGMDLDRISAQGVMTGVNTIQSGVTLQLNVGTALSANMTCYMWALCDCIVEVDPVNKTMMIYS